MTTPPRRPTRGSNSHDRDHRNHHPHEHRPHQHPPHAHHRRGRRRTRRRHRLFQPRASSATEQIVEEGVERAVEADTGENVEVDFDSDGTFSIETDDGGLSVDENGSFELETENGSITAGSDEEAWALWPTDVDRPVYIAEGTVAGSQFDDAGVWLTATGIADGEPDDAIADYLAELDGFEEVTVDAGEHAVVLTDGTYSLTVVADPAAGYPGDSIFQVTVVTG